MSADRESTPRGGGLSPRRRRRLEQRAIAERWPVPPGERVRIISRLLKTIDDPTASHRDATAACRVVLSADALNVAEQKRVPLPIVTELINDIAQKLATVIPVECHPAVLTLFGELCQDVGDAAK